MKPMGCNEMLPFLEPPHHHDVTSIAHFASIPTCMLRQVPSEVQDALWALQESTSVVYASYHRLKVLVEQRLDRMTVHPDDPTCFHEGAFLTYQSQLTNERAYLLDDCIPDWKHKLQRLKLEQYYGLSITHLGHQMTVKDWLDRLQSAVLSWAAEARATEIPSFEDTVSEYESLSTTPTSDTNGAGMSRSQTIEAGGEPAAVDKKILSPSKYKTGLGREIEEAMGVKRADS